MTSTTVVSIVVGVAVAALLVVWQLRAQRILVSDRQPESLTRSAP